MNISNLVEILVVKFLLSCSLNTALSLLHELNTEISKSFLKKTNFMIKHSGSQWLHCVCVCVIWCVCVTAYLADAATEV